MPNENYEKKKKLLDELRRFDANKIREKTVDGLNKQFIRNRAILRDLSDLQEQVEHSFAGLPDAQMFAVKALAVLDELRSNPAHQAYLGYSVAMIAATVDIIAELVTGEDVIRKKAMESTEKRIKMAETLRNVLLEMEPTPTKTEGDC